ncbi:conserved hypothetical protein [Hymenobacter roseosalivarius DSM 11622]|uniref:DUF4394 domain-containing protein n=1 Tax=Hymenobacter roseosalivarius DSM 11622 TaxID=645990 RepID=A0A1W1W0M7_9BACT|nr:DUF4394 domain-containing protein [Hymenobacter roseosalivarius]SMB99192.1 conserved hypothetical protein [Hymenobacter roseosalivarius DSM 11622]
MLKPSSLTKWGAAVLLLSSLTSCEDLLEQYFPTKPNPSAPFNLGLDIPFYALSGGNKLDAYSTKDPATRTASVTITGLQSGERILAIDFRPATGQLYGVSSASRLYVINQNTGVAHAIGAGAFTPAVSGNLVGFDFNPTVDRIRLVTSMGQNLRLNPETGTVAATDGAINGAAGATITAAAYTNNVAGAETTVLYNLDPATDKLYRQDPPNNGTLVAVGDLKLDISGDGGFDIDGKTGTALGLFEVGGKTSLFTVNVQTGATQLLSQYDAILGYSGIAIPTQPVAYAINSVGNLGNPDVPTQFLVIFDPTNPAALVRRAITGMPADQEVLGLDFRPANGQLYMLARPRTSIVDPIANSRLYTLNAASGAAALVGTVNVVLTNFVFGFDFNPVADRIRIVGNQGENVRINPNDAVATVDGRINPGPPSLSAAAYSNNFAGATTTNLYVLGTTFVRTFPNRDLVKLYLQNPPNAGTVVEIGDSGIEGVAQHFDIGGTSNMGYAYLRESGVGNKVYNIDLTTGIVRPYNNFLFNSLTNQFPGTGGGFIITGFTVGLGF